MSRQIFAILGLIWVFVTMPLMEFIGANEGSKAVADALLFRPIYERDVILAALFYLPLIACAVIWIRTTRKTNA